MAKTQPGSPAATITPETAGPTTYIELRDSASSRVGLLKPAGRDRLRDETGRGREKERARRAEQERGDGEHPDLRLAGEQRDRDQRLNHRADRIAPEHHEPPR